MVPDTTTQFVEALERFAPDRGGRGFAVSEITRYVSCSQEEAERKLQELADEGMVTNVNDDAWLYTPRHVRR